MTHLTCLCGARLTGATITLAWEAFDTHVDEKHGRSFPLGAIRIQPGISRRGHHRAPPITPQGGES